MPTTQSMISIPIAVYNELFRFQLDLFWYAHKKIYSEKAKEKSFAIIVERNHSWELIPKKINWNININKKICKSYFDYNQKIIEDGFLLPLNIQMGLLQIIDDFYDEQVLELLDCDMYHLRKHPIFEVEHDEMYVSNIYENWHLHSLTTNKNIISKYCKTNNYFNGGFVPIVATKKTFKMILNDWIFFHQDIVSSHKENNQIKWWAGMYALQAACEKNKIKMLHSDCCYIPNINNLTESHYITHYSCDKFFNKKKYPNVNLQKSPKNLHYSFIKEWGRKFGLFKIIEKLL